MILRTRMEEYVSVVSFFNFIFNLTCLIVSYVHIIQNSNSTKASRVQSLCAPAIRVPVHI